MKVRLGAVRWANRHPLMLFVLYDLEILMLLDLKSLFFYLVAAIQKRREGIHFCKHRSLACARTTLEDNEIWWLVLMGKVK